AVLVDIHRESPRDVLRNPAGLNDTLLDVIHTVSISDTAPTVQAAAVANEVMARVDTEIDKVERLVATAIAAGQPVAAGHAAAAVNGLAAEKEVAPPVAD